MTLSQIDTYRPTEDEKYMNDAQLEFFRRHLIIWRSELVNAANSFAETLKETALRNADPVDQGTINSEIDLDFRTNSRKKVLVSQIDYALSRIADGEYGYCEVTGEEIGIKRLLARPIATMCVDVQEQYERTFTRPERYAAPSAILFN